MVLINELTVEQINAALLHLQRSKDEVVGGNKGTTIQNITISNSGGGGNNVDYSGTIKNLATNIEKNKTAIEKNTSDIAKLKSDFSNIEKSVEDTLQGLSDNGISDLSFDPLTKQLTITTNDGDIYQTIIEQDISYLSYDSATNKLILTTGNQSQEITLPYILSSEKGSANGVATLDENGRVPYSQLPASPVQSDWNVTDTTSLAYIKNKPTIPASPVQSDWNVTDTTSLAYIKNKPTIPSNIVGIEDKGNNAWYPVAICTGTSCVGKSSGYSFVFNPGIGYIEFYGLSLGRGCCTESAGLIQSHGTCSNNNMICFLNNTGDAYGNGVSIGGGGIVIVGAGESASTVWSGINGTGNLYGSHAGDETLYLASDGAIYLMANVQNGYECKKTASLGTVTENNVVYGLFTADRFCGNLCGNSTSATTSAWVKGGTMRPSNSNLYPKSENGSLTHFLATSSMTTGKPSTDGHIIHMSWDNAGGWGAQLFLGNSDGGIPQYRSENGGTWTTWHNFITSENISTQHVACAVHASSADVGELSWTSCGCGVYVSGDFVRLNMYQDYDFEIYKCINCFVKVVTGKSSPNGDVFSVIGQYCCLTNNKYMRIDSVMSCSNVAYIWEFTSLCTSMSNCRTFCCTCTRMQCFTNFSLLAIR